MCSEAITILFLVDSMWDQINSSETTGKLSSKLQSIKYPRHHIQRNSTRLTFKQDLNSSSRCFHGTYSRSVFSLIYCHRAYLSSRSLLAKIGQYDRDEPEVEPNHAAVVEVNDSQHLASKVLVESRHVGDKPTPQHGRVLVD